MPTTADQRIGVLLQDRYLLVAELGAGSSAHVYLADDTRLRRPVAVKILHPGLSSDTAFRRRLVSEAHSAATLNHPNILHVYDSGDEPEGLYLVLEYLEGGSLRDLLDRYGTITVAQAAEIGLSVANVLAFADERGFIHRDVKPANLMFDELGSVHLADFGLAKALADASWSEPEGTVVGTARYASPEQALGQRVDGRSDVYSLALVLFESVTGRAPFVGDTAYANVGRPNRKRAPGRAPELGPLAPCVAAATHPDRDRRLGAAEFAEALKRVVNVLPDAESDPLRIRRVSVSTYRPPDVSNETTRIGISPGFDATLLPSDVTAIQGGSGNGAGLGHASDPKDERGRSGRRKGAGKRRGKRALVTVVALVVAAAAAFAIDRYVVFNHVVPLVLHSNLTAAEKVVAAGRAAHSGRGRGLQFAVPGGRNCQSNAIAWASRTLRCDHLCCRQQRARARPRSLGWLAKQRCRRSARSSGPTSFPSSLLRTAKRCRPGMSLARLRQPDAPVSVRS